MEKTDSEIASSFVIVFPGSENFIIVIYPGSILSSYSLFFP